LGTVHASNQGHVWYEVINPDGTTKVQAGFAPVDPKNTIAPAQGTVWHTDASAYAGDSYFTATYNITDTQANTLVNYAISPTAYGFSLTYWAVSNSCVDYVWKGLNVIGMNPSDYEGALLPIDNVARFSTLSNSSFTNNNGLVKLEKTTNSIGSSFVSGFTSTQTSMDGVNWSNSTYSFDNASAATNADHAAWEALANGSLSKTGFENVVNSSTSFLVNNNTTTYTPPTDNGIYDPIGAFYESKSAGTDPALSIANKTWHSPKPVDTFHSAV
jgi:hypothetical protein